MRKRTRACLETAVVDIWQRELGELSSRSFFRRLGASEDLVLRFDILRKLDKHQGCVNTVSFNATGDILVSGSDDTRIILWDWETGQVKLHFHSGHENNVFQAKIIPYTEGRSIVTCAADGKVRLAQILNSQVETKLLAEHHGRVHKLALVPESPHTFYTCAEDGVVKHIDLRAGTATSLFTCKAVHTQSYYSIVSLNAITINPRNPNLFAIGGSDQFARLFDIRQYKWDGSSKFDRPVDLFCPPHLVDDEHVGITGLTFSDQNELLVSYSDEFIYLFTKDIGLGPDPIFTSHVSEGSDVSNTTPDDPVGLSVSNAKENVKAVPQAYKGHRNSATVKGVNFFGPKCDYVVSGSDCGRIFIWKKKGGELVRVMEADKRIVNCIEPHPFAPVLASSGIESDIKIWVPKAPDKAILPTNIQKQRPRPKGWMHRRMSMSPEDMMLQLFSLQRPRARASPEGGSRDGDHASDVGRDLHQLLLTFNANTDEDEDSSSDGRGEDISI
ncbi:uncharacterized protein LOC127262510 isoform X2 [Andrographis paniculata]|uniref:uncharacterized protein LOC127262510 isoform X2 n=1 Tax=Andrographis paniculata TaxID=175694 RepID=UPI0021E8F3F1|nr:uncharacterized protein LOC127262510 isoform X2 [Andrographis paniculata]